MKELSIDLETYSDVDISKSGAYKYAESDNFEILLFGVSVDNEPVVVYDLTAGDEIPTCNQMGIQCLLRKSLFIELAQKASPRIFQNI